MPSSTRQAERLPIGRDPVAQVVYQATHENVEATMVDGVFLYRTEVCDLDLGNACATRKALRPISEARTSRRCSRPAGGFLPSVRRVPHTMQRLRLCTPQGAPPGPA
ncbi:MAG: hypothetical protein ACLR7Z_03035 [Bilophila wadsworthia]